MISIVTWCVDDYLEIRQYIPKHRSAKPWFNAVTNNPAVLSQQHLIQKNANQYRSQMSRKNHTSTLLTWAQSKSEQTKTIYSKFVAKQYGMAVVENRMTAKTGEWQISAGGTFNQQTIPVRESCSIRLRAAWPWRRRASCRIETQSPAY